MRISKKIAAIFLAAVMVVSAVPFVALADEVGGGGGAAGGFSGGPDLGGFTGGGQNASGGPGTAGNPVPTFPAENTPVRLNEDSYYISIEDAAADAQAGDTITLISNIEVSEPVVISEDTDIKLDLNGYSIIGNVADKMVKNYGTVEFVSANNNGGHIYNTNVAGQGRDAFINYGTLTVNADVYFGDDDEDLTNDNATTRGAGLRNFGTATINTGHFTNINNAKGVYAYAIINDGNGTVTINDATVYGHNHGNVCNNDGTVNIYDGNFSLVKTYNNSDYNLYVCETSVTNVYGGTFSCTGNYAAVCVDTEDYVSAAITILGGTFDYETTVGFKKSSATDSKVVIKGGTFCTDITAFLAPNCEQDSQTGTVSQSAANDATSIVIEETISENFYIDEAYYGGQAYVAYTYNTNSDISEEPNEETVVKPITALPQGDTAGERLLSIAQAPAQATENISVKIYASQEDANSDVNALNEYNYSIYTYCQEIINDTNDKYTQKEVALAEATLDYAAAAQNYFGYNTENMADNNYESAVEAADFSAVSGIQDRPYAIKEATVVVKSELEINLISDVALTVTGATMEGGINVPVEVVPNGSKYAVHLTGIKPANMGKDITVATSEGEFTLSANTLMKIMANSGDPALATLAKAMFLYGQAASNLFNA